MMKRTTLLTAVIILMVALGAWAEVPPGYYDAAEGLKKEALKAAMHNIIAKANTLKYGSGTASTWSGYYVTDRLPDGSVRDRYSYEKHYFSKGDNATSASAPGGMNIEHSMAKSWWGGTKNQAYEDIHHLMPSESNINSRKSNYPMGRVTNDKQGNGCTKVGTGPGPDGKNIQMWEPADEWKGDFARIYFYMATCYSNLKWQTTQGLQQMENNDWPTLQPWTYKLLLEWNRQDPVDDMEVTRNDAVYQIQGNRNPFIDHPDLCEYIWGDKTGEPWTATATTTPTTPGQPEEPSYIATYYHSIQGLTRHRLKTALFHLIQPARVLSYGGRGEGYTWSGFARTDVMPDGTVRDRYSTRRWQFNGTQAVSGMNIEHSFANSWWGHTVNNAYCDLYNLFPADGEANGRKSNNPIGEVTANVTYDNGVTRVGRSTSYRPDSLITVWEPADEWKGDFARTYFYMATCYEDYAPLWQTSEGLLMCSHTTYPTLRPWVTQLLLKWSDQDPVSDIERARNDAVQAIQGNRNPYVDLPQLAHYVWGDSTTCAFYFDRSLTTPQLYVPLPGATIDMGLHPFNGVVANNIEVRGRSLTAPLTLSIDNPAFTLSHTQLTPVQVEQGTPITITYRATTPGTVTANLTIGLGTPLQNTLLINVQTVDGIPAYPARDIVCAVSSKRFTATWKDMGPGHTYTLDVTTADGRSITGYPIQTTDTIVQVKGLKASTTYHYTVTSGTLKSNTVIVRMPPVKPVFSASAQELTFTSTPGTPSQEQALTVTAIEVPEYKTQCTATEPFEVSDDRDDWQLATTLTGSTQTLYVRLGPSAPQGHTEGELILSTRDVDDIVIPLSADVDDTKAFFESFETGTKSSYAAAQATCAAATWHMDNTLIGRDANDSKNDAAAVRMKAPATLTMTTDKLGGCDSLWFWASAYNKDAGATLAVSYSTDQGSTWVTIMPPTTMTGGASGAWRRYAFKLDISAPLRLRFQTAGTSGKRVNIDDIQMSSHRAPDNIHTPATRRDTSTVDIYTTTGIKLLTAPRSQAHKTLRQGTYIIK